MGAILLEEEKLTEDEQIAAAAALEEEEAERLRIEAEQAAKEKADLEANETAEEKEERERLEREAAELAANEDDEIIVTIGDEEPKPDEETAPAWVKEVRQRNRELSKENKELRKAQEASAEPESVVVGKKPSMDDPDIDYDSDKFEAALTSYYDRKREADAAAKEIEAANESQAKAWQGTLDGYGASKEALKVKDYDDAESAVQDSLSEVQQAIILHGADNPALVVYALGKNPGKVKELAGITDNVKLAFAVAKLEAQLKMTKRKPASNPEGSLQGSGAVAGTSEATLKRLEAEADKTGDRTKLQAYKKKMKNS